MGSLGRDVELDVAGLTLQEARWWTARLMACFFRDTRLAQHFSQRATFQPDPRGSGWAHTAPLHAEDMAHLTRSPSVPGGDLYGGTASAFRRRSPPSGGGRSSGRRSLPGAQEPSDSQ